MTIPIPVHCTGGIRTRQGGSLRSLRSGRIQGHCAVPGHLLIAVSVGRMHGWPLPDRRFAKPDCGTGRDRCGDPSPHETFFPAAVILTGYTGSMTVHESFGHRTGIPPFVKRASMKRMRPGRRTALYTRHCRIRDGKAGFCGTRMNVGGTLYTLIYGDINALESRPIEIKPFFHFHAGSRALTFSTWGCNFACPGARTTASPGGARTPGRHAWFRRR